MGRKTVFLAVLAVALGLAVLAGCADTSKGSISGTVTDSLGDKPVSDVSTTTAPAVEGVKITTDAKGKYTATLPVGDYTLTFSKTGFDSFTAEVAVIGGKTAKKDVTLVPKTPVIANAGADKEASPGEAVALNATAALLDGSTVVGYKWTQTAGVPAKLQNAESATATVTLGDSLAYKSHLIEALHPLDRFVVQGINPHALEEAETATFKVTVTTSSGTYSDTVNVVADLPYVVSTGIQNVPVGVPVLLGGKKQNAYRWTLTGARGSSASLDDPSVQNPVFTPDVVGKYSLSEANSGATLDVYAGRWMGVITGQDAKGRPTADAACTTCHNNSTAPDQFTAWAASGHAEILTQNINNPAGHWTVSCASCHTVGYDLDADNHGFDEAMAEEGWKAPEHGDPKNWTAMLASYPGTARLANIQCENCHGPQDTAAHTNALARTSLSSDVCGTCHGEPLRHARFQQWEESGHGDFTLAVSRGTSSSCARCHTTQGFLIWLEQGDLTKSIQGAKGNATADELRALGAGPDTAQPVTCVACHDPHAQGTTSGEPNTATVRVQGDTAKLPAGFQAKSVGKGALCMTCHNTRNALHNDAYPPTSYSAPHTAAQADVVMGENAYFVSEGQRSAHSYLKDTCVTCHLQETPPPAELSYNRSGTNHTFEAGLAICASCHSSALDGKALQVGIEEKLHKLAEKMGQYLLSKLPVQITIKDYTPHETGGKSYDLLSDPVVVGKDNIASAEPTEPHGQQGFIIKFKSPVAFTYKPSGEAPHTLSLKEAEVRLGDITTDGTAALIPTSDALVKAGWNYFLIEGDGSEGIHNPSFTLDVLEATIEALSKTQ